MQIGHYLHYMARFLAGFAVGFSSVWQLTLLTVAVVPLMAIAGGAYAAAMTGLSKKSQLAYVEAGKVAEEVSSPLSYIFINAMFLRLCIHLHTHFHSLMQMRLHMRLPCPNNSYGEK
jgi:uncharacterized membrane protein